MAPGNSALTGQTQQAGQSVAGLWLGAVVTASRTTTTLRLKTLSDGLGTPRAELNCDNTQKLKM